MIGPTHVKRGPTQVGRKLSHTYSMEVQAGGKGHYTQRSNLGHLDEKRVANQLSNPLFSHW